MPPRVVVSSLASDFGCQVQLTNMTDQSWPCWADRALVLAARIERPHAGGVRRRDRRGRGHH